MKDITERRIENGIYHEILLRLEKLVEEIDKKVDVLNNNLLVQGEKNKANYREYRVCRASHKKTTDAIKKKIDNHLAEEKNADTRYAATRVKVGLIWGASIFLGTTFTGSLIAYVVAQFLKTRMP